MNVSELARKLRINSAELLEILPELGFDVGKKAIKVDEKVAGKILDLGNKIRDRIEAKKKEQQEEIKKTIPAVAEATEKREIKIPAVITVKNFALTIDKPVNEVIKSLMKNGVLASLNERIDFDTASIIADEMGLKLSLSEEEIIGESGMERIKGILQKEEKSNLKLRAPIVVVMGHVDHGKTKLLDTIRKTNVVEGEAGGITQHIGAYQVKKKGQLITFIDTPGHEAFTAMRSRGARVADIAILVVAANDSVKPQTLEAIKIIQQAKIPMIVAINKIDLPDANIEKVKKDLSSLNLIPEDWGGKTICLPISAKNNLGIDELLEAIVLVSELEKDKIVANPDTLASGTIIEAHLDKGEGAVATLLVQNGTLKVGDNLCIEQKFYGKVRALKDYRSQDINEAGPAMPVKIIGFKLTPKVGDIVEVSCQIERKNKKFSSHEILRGEGLITKVNKAEKEDEEEGVKKLNLIIKTDVLGSLEVISETLEKIESGEVKANIISQGLGNINDSDVDLANSSKALILGFHVKATASAEDLAREKNVEIKFYDIVYNLFDEVKARLSAMLSPELVRKELGKATVVAIFKTENKFMIIGGKVISGKVVKGAKADVLRNKQLIISGEISELQSAKENVTEVAAGQEFGLKFSGKSEIKVGDILLAYQEEKIIKKL